MKLDTTQQVRVGIFVTLGLLFCMAVIFLLGKGFGIFEREFTFYASFKDVGGLRIDAPIYLAGIQIGQVEEIYFPKPIEERKVIVQLLVKRKFKNRIRKDSVASINTQGLLGDKAVSITLGTPQNEELKDEEFIAVREGDGIEAFAKKGSDLLDSLTKLTKDIREGKGLVHALIYDPEGEKIIGDLAKVSRSTGDIVRQIQTGKNTLHSLIYEKEYERNVSQSIANLQKSTKNLEAVTAKIEKGEGSIGGLINDPTVYYDLMTLLGKANRNKLLRTVIRATLATNEKDLNQN